MARNTLDAGGAIVAGIGWAAKRNEIAPVQTACQRLAMPSERFLRRFRSKTLKPLVQLGVMEIFLPRLKSRGTHESPRLAQRPVASCVPVRGAVGGIANARR